MTAAVDPAPGARPVARTSIRAGVVGVALLAALFVGGLLWAKWLPYAGKTRGLSQTHTWPGTAIFASAGADSSPSLSGAWHFTTAYFQSVWQAATVALLVAAAVDALVPRAWLLSVLNRRTALGQSLAGGTAALPSLMCTCCTAPVAVGLRKRGATVAASLAYWVGNPVLNPAVLVFLFLVAPWQFGAVRIVVGAVLVFGATAFAARFAKGPADTAVTPAADPGQDPLRVRDLPLRYLRSLARFAAVLVPEYFVAVMVIGGLSGPLSDFAGVEARLGVLAVAVCAVIGTMLVIPTGGEIPVVLALTAAGASVGTAGALLITLPALSIPSMLMVGRQLSWRATAAMAAAVVVAGLVGGALLWALW
ncbi:permease [Streptomyces hyderabadensis]|uniref:Permease n=2 Tax=Streptomyces hyderabadensis TaxID=598549 RepID=A0ABP9IN58_9ACTN